MRLKKYICLLLCLALTAALLVGCTSQEEEEPQDQDTEEQTDTQEQTDGEEETQADTIEVYSGVLDENGFFAGIRASDIVTLPGL